MPAQPDEMTGGLNPRVPRNLRRGLNLVVGAEERWKLGPSARLLSSIELLLLAFAGVGHFAYGIQLPAADFAVRPAPAKKAAVGC